MTTEGYIEMCEVMGQEIDPAMLMGLEDFPDPIIVAVEIYNYLPDLYIAGMEGAIYLGKDLTNCFGMLKINGIVDDEDSRLSLWALKKMNDRIRKKSFAKAKKKTKGQAGPQ